ncbi:MAG: MFS transporter [Gammaproteobacteria bacterium]|nr:MFS transporter [Gammaproteobacteria bacterium]
MQHTNSSNVSPRTLGFFSSGGLAWGVIRNGEYVVLMYYSQVLGLDPGMAGLALAIGLIIDAVSDPIIGYLSDNTHSRWGRRHPYLYTSIIPLALSFYLLWHPPASVQGDDTPLFIYLLVCNATLRFSTTLFLIPALAMVAELTSDYDQRTRLLSGLQAVYSVIMNGMSFLMYAFWLVPTSEIVDGVMNVEGYRDAGLFGAVVIFVSVLLFSLGLHRSIPRTNRDIIKKSSGFRQFIEQVSTLFRIQSMRVVMVVGIVYYMGLGAYAVMWVYIYSYFWEFTTVQLSLIVIPMTLGGLFLSPLMARLIKDREKKNIAIFGLLMASLVNVVPVALRLLGLFPENGSETLFWIMLMMGFFETIFFLVFQVSWYSMSSDITEQIELETGRRNEGIISSTVTFASKCATGLGTLLAGTLLALIAFPTQSAVGNIPDDTLFNLGLIYGPMIMTIFLICCFALSRYSLSRSHHASNVEHLPHDDTDKIIGLPLLAEK